jgi:hypothetical protein
MNTLALDFYCLMARVQLFRSRQREREYPLVWYAVAAIVLFSLGATILLGAIVWCDIHGMRFGAVRQKNWYTWYVGCFR